MPHFNLALIGFGNVHRALLQLLNRKRTELLQTYDLTFNVTGVYSRRMGFLADPDGFDISALLEGRVTAPLAANLHDWLERASPTLLFEASSLDPFTGQPAISYIQAALENSIHVVTANKGPIVHASHALLELARAQGVKFRFEATFMGGSPIYSLLRECLPAAKLLRFQGLPNGTTTMILEAIEEGLSFEEGVKRAQDFGIAETDSSFDVDGWDSVVKIIGLANTVMGSNIGIGDVERIGIRDLPLEQIRASKQSGTPIRLVATLEPNGDTVRASVKPTQLEMGSAMAGIGGSDMMARLEFDVLPALEIVTRGAGASETAYDMLADFIGIAR